MVKVTNEIISMIDKNRMRYVKLDYDQQNLNISYKYFLHTFDHYIGMADVK